MITQQELKERLDYNPATGAFTWINPTSSRVHVGDIAGSVAKGYRIIGIGKRYFAHVLAWLFVYGEWPASVIDHIDRNKGNNAISNLRLASKSQNMANAKISRLNKSGFRGVDLKKARTSTGKERLWRAVIRSNRKYRHLGLFNTAEEAKAAYDKAALELWGEFYNKAS